jgi:hypothetical protein
MSNKNHKHPNAQKHGVYGKITFILGENPAQFAELYSGLIEEWMPDGATEEDCVLTIAKGVWRKRRVQEFVGVQLLKNSVDPSHPSHDAIFDLRCFIGLMEREPETAFEKYAGRRPGNDKINYLRKKFPRSEFDSTAKWAQAVINEITSVLLPEIGPIDHAAAVGAVFSSAENLGGDAFKQELALDERLDAMIDRAVKRLIQIKAMKQMLAQTGATRVRQQRLS